MKEEEIYNLLKDYGFFNDSFNEVEIGFYRNEESGDYIYENVEFFITLKDKLGYSDLFTCKLFALVGSPNILIMSNIDLNTLDRRLVDYRLVNKLSRLIFEYITEIADKLGYCEFILFANDKFNLDFSFFDYVDTFVDKKTLITTNVGIKRLSQVNYPGREII